MIFVDVATVLALEVTPPAECDQVVRVIVRRVAVAMVDVDAIDLAAGPTTPGAAPPSRRAALPVLPASTFASVGVVIGHRGS